MSTSVNTEQTTAAWEFSQSLGNRRRSAGAPVANAFVSASDLDSERTPLAQLLSTAPNGGGGRGGQVRLKLYLSLLWVAAKSPYTVRRPARAWAALLGLPDIETKGVRRIQEAMRDLRDLGWVHLEDQVGFPSTVWLRSERGDGSDYVPAPDEYNRLSAQGAAPDTLARFRYFRVPSTVWTKGHIARLNGPSLAMLLVLLCEQRGSDKPVWFSPGRAADRFTLSPSTRTAGLKHLRELELIESFTTTVSDSGNYIDFARRRTVHRVTGL